MEVTATRIPGAWIFEPRVHADARGSFCECFKADVFRDTAGHPLTLAQSNMSVSRAGTVRGVHFADVPPGQAKYVTCQAGAVVDVVVDIRVGSPTYGQWDSVALGGRTGRSVYLSEGLGHAFVAVADQSVVSYLCSTPYTPEREHGIYPTDPALGIEWAQWLPEGAELLLSDRDRAAPTLADAQDLLPSYDACQEYIASLWR